MYLYHFYLLLLHVKNQGNVADNNGNDIQLTLGLRYEI